MTATLTTIPAPVIRQFRTGELDIEDDANVKGVLRQLLGLKRISADLVDEFRAMVEEETDDEPNDDEEAPSRSIVKKSYKRAYRPFHQTCGDDFAGLLRQHLEIVTEEGKRIDPDRLERFAKANDCWVPSYAQLNVGQRRMNVGNRLRAKVAKGHEVVWA